jgi:hypothetical protein
MANIHIVIWMTKCSSLISQDHHQATKKRVQNARNRFSIHKLITNTSPSSPVDPKEDRCQPTRCTLERAPHAVKDACQTHAALERRDRGKKTVENIAEKHKHAMESGIDQKRLTPEHEQ